MVLSSNRESLASVWRMILFVEEGSMCKRRLVAVLLPLLILTGSLLAADRPAPAPAPRLVGHRGLFKHAPENTLASFVACLDLRLGLELDVRRTRDGHLVCLHDADVQRTTNGKGKVADLSLEELRRLDAGRWFDPIYTGLKVPTLEEVFVLLRERKQREVLAAIDFKINDDRVAEDVVQLADKQGILRQLVCIGIAIENQAFRQRLKKANPQTPVARLVPGPEQLAEALEDNSADWIYIRFVPTAEQMERIHKAGKKVFLTGPKVAGNEPENWSLARKAGVDALLTDYPLECRAVWRQGQGK